MGEVRINFVHDPKADSSRAEALQIIHNPLNLNPVAYTLVVIRLVIRLEIGRRR
ncbi:hypothetical protein [Paenibacillus anseongense]|uniref:hypothetical protein n=1 Tax=Paenibacillus anseongense TaxID=2682845 RepID=UPI002DB9AEB4|nr:hypothetical protein [Paenibacillus anseongense]MEC0266780.1 hypothetical protein [Paenibacillus anseongense]